MSEHEYVETVKHNPLVTPDPIVRERLEDERREREEVERMDEELMHSFESHRNVLSPPEVNLSPTKPTEVLTEPSDHGDEETSGEHF